MSRQVNHLGAESDVILEERLVHVVGSTMSEMTQVVVGGRRVPARPSNPARDYGDFVCLLAE